MKTSQDVPLSYAVEPINDEFCYIHITVPAEYINLLYDHVSRAQQNHINTYGFGQRVTPVEYIQEHYRSNIIEHITQFLFKYFVINFFYDSITAEKLNISGEPRLHDIFVEPGKDALFTFEVSLAKPIDFREWKHFPFKAPKRKNYKDIDRQVESFIKEETTQQENASSADTVTIGDWVCFDITLLVDEKPLCSHYTKNAWLKIGSEEADIPFQEVFLGKKNGQTFITSAPALQRYFSTDIATNYSFQITICDVISCHYFCFDDFKHHFKLKTQKDVHHKFIEIFSYRNDISQRRSIVEEAIKLLFSKHHIEVPNHLILRQQKVILEALQSNPDYQVYKTEKNFKENVRLLALKQAKEMLLIDQLAHKENIHVTNKDIRSYLNFLKRQRTKEFIYFNPPPTKVDGQEMPVPSALLKRCCLREKTLNHMIYHLTKK